MQKYTLYNQDLKTTGIDSILQIPKHPMNIYYWFLPDESEGGKDGGVQEKHTNLHEGVSIGWQVAHEMHENTHSDPS